MEAEENSTREAGIVEACDSMQAVGERIVEELKTV